MYVLFENVHDITKMKIVWDRVGWGLTSICWGALSSGVFTIWVAYNELRSLEYFGV